MADKLQLDVNRGQKAAALLDDEIVKLALDEMEHSYTEAWLATGARDTDARERLWQAVQVTRKFRDHLRLMVSDGKLAQVEIDAMAAREVKAA